MVIIDALVRLIPGVLGNRYSAETDSLYNGLLSHPEYTRPEVFEGMQVPPVLLSGTPCKYPSVAEGTGGKDHKREASRSLGEVYWS